jgi:DNA-binding MarR family transcriptional regulator
MTRDREALRAWLDLLGAAHAIKKMIDQRLRERFDLSISRFDVLSALDRAGPEGLRAGALSQRLMVTEGNTTQVTAPLISAGLVERAQSPEDGRAAIFRLTRKGRSLFARMAEDHRRFVREAFARYSAGDIETLRALLAHLNFPDDRPIRKRDAA